jgi:hypothetical protein
MDINSFTLLQIKLLQNHLLHYNNHIVMMVVVHFLQLYLFPNFVNLAYCDRYCLSVSYFRNQTLNSGSFIR